MTDTDYVTARAIPCPKCKATVGKLVSEPASSVRIAACHACGHLWVIRNLRVMARTTEEPTTRGRSAPRLEAHVSRIRR